MTTLQIIGLIGIGIIIIGAILFAKERVKIGIILLIIGLIVGMTGSIGHQAELDKNIPNIPTALDVYRGKTTLEITYRDGVAIDSVVVYKMK